MVRLHLGCGTHIVPGWVNIDGSWNARLRSHPLLGRVGVVLRLIPAQLWDLPWNANVVCHNVTKPLPFQDSSASCIYSSHMLEHLYREEARALLAECYRVLVHDGILRLVVPDLQARVQRYFAAKRDASAAPEPTVCAADQLNMDLGFRQAHRTKGSLAFRLYTSFMDFHTHKWMYDAESLRRLFVEAGFSDVVELGALQSRIPDIAAVEQVSRVLEGQSICIEGGKK